MTYLPSRDRSARRRNQRGMMLTWTAVSIVTICAMSALTIDMGMMYWRKAEAKKAADAAALAGAWQFTLPGKTVSDAKTTASTYAGYNGYSLDPANPPHLLANDNTKFQVAVKRTEAKCFLGIFNTGAWYSSAVSTAQFKIPVDAPVQGKDYGYGNTPYSFSLFGPYGLHSNGDTFSTMYLNNGTANPEYNPDGYPFTLNIPSDYASRNNTSLVQVELFDPTTTDTGHDEIRAPYTTISNFDEYTTTKYSLQYKSATDPNASWADIASTSFHKEAAAVNKWVTPSGFKFDINNYTGDQFRIVVQSTNGSSENGFSLRAGPPTTSTGTTYTNEAGTNYTISSLPDTGSGSWHSLYSGFDSSGNPINGGVNGTTIAAHGYIPLNINTSGTIDILLGYVPSQAAGGNFHVTRFDTDVGATDLYYWTDATGFGPSVHFNHMTSSDSPARLGSTTNDKGFTDLINLPSNYPGGNWHAAYTAGSADTSSWSIGWQQVNLVGGAGLTY